MFKTAVLKLSFGIADVLMLEVVIEITKLQRKFTSSKYVIPTIIINFTKYKQPS